MTPRSLQRRYNVLLVLRWLPVGFIAPILVLVFLERDIRLSQLGFVLGAYGLVTLLAEVPTGGLADAYGRRRVLIVSSLFQLGFFVMVLSSEGVLLMTLASAIGGVSRALDSGPLEAWYVDSAHGLEGVDVERGLARGNAIDGMSLAAGALAAGFIGSASGGDLDVVILIAMSAQILHVVGVALLMTDEPAVGAETSTGAMSAVSEARSLIAGKRNLQIILAAGIGLGFALASVETFFQPRFAELLEGRDSTTSFLGLLLAAAFAASAVGAELGPRIRRALGWEPGRFLLGAALAQGCCFSVIALADGAVLTAAGFVSVYAVLGLMMPVASNLLHEQVSANARTTIVSAQSVAFQLGAFAGVMTLAPLAGAWSIPWIWAVAAAVVVLTGLVYSRLSTRPL